MILRGENAGGRRFPSCRDNSVRCYSQVLLTLYNRAGNNVESLGIVLLIKAIESWNGEHG